jgi:hypothetical protein
LEIEEPVACRYASAFHFHVASTGMLGPTLIGDQVVEVREPGEKRLLTAVWIAGVSSRGTESWDRSQLFHKLIITQVAIYAF